MEKVMKVNRSTADNLKTMYMDSPVGLLEIQSTELGIRTVNFVDKPFLDVEESTYNTLTMKQLEEYFAGTRTVFELPFDLEGTPFQQKVWQELGNIPFGKTISYLDLAKKLGDIKVIRAAASANGKNPLWIVVPCHRVIGTDGSLTGYAGGLWRKKWLLEHENPTNQQSLF